MSLDLKQLEKARELNGGIVQARCPACAESGGDRKGEHLRIQPDGRFGCCLHPKDKIHRKRIHALVGDHSPRTFTVRVATNQRRPKTAVSVTSSLKNLDGTFGTPVPELNPSQRKKNDESGTLGTDIFDPYAYSIKTINQTCDDTHTCKDWAKGVPSVPAAEDWKRRQPDALIDEGGRPLPYVKVNGTLVIPFDSDKRFHYWKSGQSLALTRREACWERG